MQEPGCVFFVEASIVDSEAPGPDPGVPQRLHPGSRGNLSYLAKHWQSQTHIARPGLDRMQTTNVSGTPP